MANKNDTKGISVEISAANVSKVLGSGNKRDADALNKLRLNVDEMSRAQQKANAQITQEMRDMVKQFSDEIATIGTQYRTISNQFEQLKSATLSQYNALQKMSSGSKEYIALEKTWKENKEILKQMKSDMGKMEKALSQEKSKRNDWLSNSGLKIQNGQLVADLSSRTHTTTYGNRNVSSAANKSSVTKPTRAMKDINDEYDNLNAQMFSLAERRRRLDALQRVIYKYNNMSGRVKKDSDIAKEIEDVYKTLDKEDQALLKDLKQKIYTQKGYISDATIGKMSDEILKLTGVRKVSGKGAGKTISHEGGIITNSIAQIKEARDKVKVEKANAELYIERKKIWDEQLKQTRESIGAYQKLRNVQKENDKVNAEYIQRQIEDYRRSTQNTKQQISQLKTQNVNARKVASQPYVPLSSEQQAKYSPYIQNLTSGKRAVIESENGEVPYRQSFNKKPLPRPIAAPSASMMNPQQIGFVRYEDSDAHYRFREGDARYDKNGIFQVKVNGKWENFDRGNQAHRRMALASASSFGKGTPEIFEKLNELQRSGAIKQYTAKSIANVAFGGAKGDSVANVYNAQMYGDIGHAYGDLTNHLRQAGIINRNQTAAGLGIEAVKRMVSEYGAQRRVSISGMKDLEAQNSAMSKLVEMEQNLTKIISSIEQETAEYQRFNAGNDKMVFRESDIDAVLREQEAIMSKRGRKVTGTEIDRVTRLDMSEALKRYGKFFTPEEQQKIKSRLYNGKYFDYGAQSDIEYVTPEGRIGAMDNKYKRQVDIGETLPQLALQGYAQLAVTGENNLSLLDDRYISQMGKRGYDGNLGFTRAYGVAMPTDEDFAYWILGQLAGRKDIGLHSQISSIVDEGYYDEKTGQVFTAPQVLVASDKARGAPAKTGNKKLSLAYNRKNFDAANEEYVRTVLEKVNGGYISPAEGRNMLLKTGRYNKDDSFATSEDDYTRYLDFLTMASSVAPSLISPKEVDSLVSERRAVNRYIQGTYVDDQRATTDAERENLYYEDLRKAAEERALLYSKYYLPEEEQDGYTKESEMTPEEKAKKDQYEAQKAYERLSKHSPLSAEANLPVFSSSDFLNAIIQNPESIYSLGPVKGELYGALKDAEKVNNVGYYAEGTDGNRMAIVQPGGYSDKVNELQNALLSVQGITDKFVDAQDYFSLYSDLSTYFLEDEFIKDFANGDAIRTKNTPFAEKVAFLNSEKYQSGIKTATQNRGAKLASLFTDLEKTIDMDFIKQFDTEDKVQAVMGLNLNSLRRFGNEKDLMAYKLRRIPQEIARIGEMATPFMPAADQESFEAYLKSVTGTMNETLGSSDVIPISPADYGEFTSKIEFIKQAMAPYLKTIPESDADYFINQLQVLKDFTTLRSKNNLSESIKGLGDYYSSKGYSKQTSPYMASFIKPAEDFDPERVNNFLRIVAEGNRELSYKNGFRTAVRQRLDQAAIKRMENPAYLKEMILNRLDILGGNAAPDENFGVFEEEKDNQISLRGLENIALFIKDARAQALSLAANGGDVITGSGSVFDEGSFLGKDAAAMGRESGLEDAIGVKEILDKDFATIQRLKDLKEMKSVLEKGEELKKQRQTLIESNFALRKGNRGARGRKREDYLAQYNAQETQIKELEAQIAENEEAKKKFGRIPSMDKLDKQITVYNKRVRDMANDYGLVGIRGTADRDEAAKTVLGASFMPAHSAFYLVDSFRDLVGLEGDQLNKNVGVRTDAVRKLMGSAHVSDSSKQQFLDNIYRSIVDVQGDESYNQNALELFELLLNKLFGSAYATKGAKGAPQGTIHEQLYREGLGLGIESEYDDSQKNRAFYFPETVVPNTVQRAVAPSEVHTATADKSASAPAVTAPVNATESSDVPGVDAAAQVGTPIVDGESGAASPTGDTSNTNVSKTKGKGRAKKTTEKSSQNRKKAVANIADSTGGGSVVIQGATVNLQSTNVSLTSSQVTISGANDVIINNPVNLYINGATLPNGNIATSSAGGGTTGGGGSGGSGGGNGGNTGDASNQAANGDANRVKSLTTISQLLNQHISLYKEIEKENRTIALLAQDQSDEGKLATKEAKTRREELIEMRKDVGAQIKEERSRLTPEARATFDERSKVRYQGARQSVAIQDARALYDARDDSAKEYEQLLSKRLQIESKIDQLQQRRNTSNWGPEIKLIKTAIDEQQKLLTLNEQDVAVLKQKGLLRKEDAQRIEAQYAAQRSAQKAQNMTNMHGAQNLWDLMGYDIKRSFAMIFNFGVAHRAIYAIRAQIQQLITSMQELDVAMTNIRIVTGQTNEEASDLMKTYNDMASQLGVTTKAIAEASNEWLRQGYSVTEANDLIQASTYLSKLGMIESSQATEYLTSMLKGFKLEATEAMSAVDLLTNLDMKFAASAGEIAEGLSRMATTAQMAGMSLEEAAAAVTVITDVTQKSASSIGESILKNGRLTRNCLVKFTLKLRKARDGQRLTMDKNYFPNKIA